MGAQNYLYTSLYYQIGLYFQSNSETTHIDRQSCCDIITSYKIILQMKHERNVCMEFYNTETHQVVNIDIYDSDGISWISDWINVADFEYNEDNNRFNLSNYEWSNLIDFVNRGPLNEEPDDNGSYIIQYNEVIIEQDGKTTRICSDDQKVIKTTDDGQKTVLHDESED